MKIAAINVSHHRLKLDPPFRPSWDFSPRHHFDATVVRVTTDEGHEGVGSGDAMLGFEGHEHLFLGEDPLRLERHFRLLSNIQFHGGRCWPLDLALWDLAGKITGQPVWKLLGGRCDRIPAYASSATLRDDAEMAETAARFHGAGFAAMKVRFHRPDWREDIAALQAARDVVGDRLTLMVDCNQGWRMAHDDAPPWSFKDALAVARELERLGVYWMEEPLFRGDAAGMRRLSDATDIRIAGGEMNRELHEFRALIEGRCLDVLQPDAALVGGITGLRRVAVMAEEAGLVFTPHTWTNGLGLIANAHLTAGLAAAPFIEYPFDPPEWSLQRRDFMLCEPVGLQDGMLVLSEKPGFGVELDEERLERSLKR
ncbi:mandelate racemase/muconate lactonizing enzyme family protein [Afifella pfennigii]|uniref:mandelate racemase/muconate lactonizing enzyme family protein n=1 Tax=Afifella pfennigii TaxID=209897 RepID=UPI000478AC32|nr:mandelate racemase/muconate lactonizing enzyme family protein [Afifella pfennigii]